MLSGQSRHLRSAPIRWCLLCVMSIASAAISAAPQSEESVKAAFLYRFTGFVEWPAEAHATTFTIAVLGSKGVTNELESILLQQSIQNRPARVRTAPSAREAAGAHMLYAAPD